MINPKKLKLGTGNPSPSMHEEESRVATLQATIEHYLPEFVSAIKNASTDADGDEAKLLLLDMMTMSTLCWGWQSSTPGCTV